jgi:hypothetical protein
MSIAMFGSFKIKMQFAIDDLAQTNYNQNINKTQIK